MPAINAPGQTSATTPKRQSSFEIVTVNFNPASVAANTTAEQTITITGVAVGDVVFVNKPSLNAGLGIVNARVSAANTVAVTFSNNTATPIDAGAENYLFLIMRQAQVTDSFSG